MLRRCEMFGIIVLILTVKHSIHFIRQVRVQLIPSPQPETRNFSPLEKRPMVCNQKLPIRFGCVWFNLAVSCSLAPKSDPLPTTEMEVPPRLKESTRSTWVPLHALLLHRLASLLIHTPSINSCFLGFSGPGSRSKMYIPAIRIVSISLSSVS